MTRPKKISVFRFAKFQAILLGLVGLLLGVVYSVGGLFMDIMVSAGWIISSETPGLSYGTFLAFDALFVMPLISFSVGFVLGLVEGVMYNFFRKWIGNIMNDFYQ